MDNKEAIIQATMTLIEEKGEHLEEITVRDICKCGSWFRACKLSFWQ